jgi:hypothetical protein
MSIRPIALAVALVLGFCANCLIAGEPAGEKEKKPDDFELFLEGILEKANVAPRNDLPQAQVQVDVIFAEVENGYKTRKAEAAYDRWFKLVSPAYYTQVDGHVLYTPGRYFLTLENEKTWRGSLQSLRRHGLATIVAEPKLVTIAGRSASFSTGIEIPVPAPSGLGVHGLGVFLSYTVTPSLKADQICLKSKLELGEPTSLFYMDDGNSCSYRRVNVVSTNCTLKEGTTLLVVVPSKPARPARPWWVEYLREIPAGIGDWLVDNLCGTEPYAETAIFMTPHIVKPMETRQMAN